MADLAHFAILGRYSRTKPRLTWSSNHGSRGSQKGRSGLGGLGGLGWSGFVRSAFRPPDKRLANFFFVPASPDQGARYVRPAASKGQICPAAGRHEVPWYSRLKPRLTWEGRLFFGRLGAR